MVTILVKLFLIQENYVTYIAVVRPHAPPLVTVQPKLYVKHNGGILQCIALESIQSISKANPRTMTWSHRAIETLQIVQILEYLFSC